MISRSPSPAVTSPQSRTENTASHRDILSLCASNDDEFNKLPSEDDQDLAPDPELTNLSDPHSEVASEDIQFRMLIEEVLKLLPADMFPRKTDEFPGGNRPRSSIDLELQKVAKKSISLPQSRRPLMRAIDCLKESLGARGWMILSRCLLPFLRTGYLPKLTSKSLYRLDVIKLIMSFYPRLLHRLWTLTQLVWVCLLRVLILLN